MKAILTDTIEQAFEIISQIDSRLGYPNEETGTITYTKPMKHSNQIQYIVLVPDDSYSDLGNIQSINPETDIYIEPFVF